MNKMNSKHFYHELRSSFVHGLIIDDFKNRIRTYFQSNEEKANLNKGELENAFPSNIVKDIILHAIGQPTRRQQGKVLLKSSSHCSVQQAARVYSRLQAWHWL